MRNITVKPKVQTHFCSNSADWARLLVTSMCRVAFSRARSSAFLLKIQMQGSLYILSIKIIQMDYIVCCVYSKSQPLEQSMESQL